MAPYFNSKFFLVMSLLYLYIKATAWVKIMLLHTDIALFITIYLSNLHREFNVIVKLIYRRQNIKLAN